MFIITLGYIYIIVNNNITSAAWSDVLRWFDLVNDYNKIRVVLIMCQRLSQALIWIIKSLYILGFVIFLSVL